MRKLHSSILAWEIHCTEDSSGKSSTQRILVHGGHKRVRQDLVTKEQQH